jgi:DNA polymerase III delta prime subunit
VICDSVTVKCRVKWVREQEAVEELVLSMLKERDGVYVGDAIEIADAKCEVVKAEPDSGCEVYPLTEISVSQVLDVDVRHVGNVVVVRENGKVLVWDSITWNKVFNTIIKPLREGGKPLSNGYRLAGLPGVGKTELSRLIGYMSGAYTIAVDSGSLLSKWVGDSEKRLRNIFRRLMSTPGPGVLILNDFDTLLSGGRTVTEVGSEVYSNLLNIFNNYFDMLIGTDKVVLATTNLSALAIDPAIRRRLVPIYIPPPTTDAVKVWLAEEPHIATEAMKVLGKEQVEGFVIREAMRGASWGHIVRSLQMGIATGKLESVFEEEFAGYRLLNPYFAMPDVPTAVRNHVIQNVGNEPAFKAIPGVGEVSGDYANVKYTALARVLAFITGQVFNRHVVVLMNPQFIQDAIAVTKQLNGILLVHGLLDVDSLRLVLDADVPVLFETMPVEARVALPVLYAVPSLPQFREYLFNAVNSFYGIPCKNPTAVGKPASIEQLMNYAWYASLYRTPCENLVRYMNAP